MGIQDNTQDNGNGNRTAMSEAFARNSGDQQRGESGAGQRPHVSLRRLSSLYRNNIARTPMSEKLSKLETRFKEIYEPYGDNLDIKLIALDKQSNVEIACSVLIVGARLKGVSNGNLVAYHTLVLANPEPLQSKLETWNGQQYEVKRLTSDLWNNQLRTIVENHVKRAFQTDNTQDMAACIVPVDFPVEDDFQTQQLAGNALIAVNTELERRAPGFQDLQLNNVSRDSNLETRIVFSDQNIVGADGKPVRADVRINLNASARQQDPSLDSVTECISQVTGYMDIDFVGPAQQAVTNPFLGYQGQQQQAQIGWYQPNFVITSMETLASHTMPAQLLALAQVLMLRTGAIWTQAFWPRPTDKEVDIRDIGALGYEVGFERDEAGNGKYIDTKSARFTPDIRAGLLAALFRPELTVSMDVAVAGPETWYNDPFVASAYGREEARTEIIRAANVLTAGEFGRIYQELQGSGSPVFTNGNRMHLGTYRDPSGQVRDIRDLDYIAMANFVGRHDLAELRKYSDSLLALNEPPLIREAKRARIITNNLGTQVFDGFALRVTFEAKFLQALAEGCARAGLSLQPRLPESGVVAYERATANFGSGVMPGSGQSSLFQSGYVGQQAGGAFQGPGYQGRWTA